MADGFIIRRGGSSSGDNIVNSKLPTFTYTGTCRLIDDGDGNWRIKFFTSGTLKFTKLPSTSVDIFCVGAGGGGNTSCGGGGGYTKTVFAKTLAVNTNYTITIGAGTFKGNGGVTSFGTLNKAAGGYVGGNGGSGGGGYKYNLQGVTGGSNGGNGTGDSAGKGQIATAGPNGETGNTYEFADTTSTLYAGGGAGRGWTTLYYVTYGGEGGGGDSGSGGNPSMGEGMQSSGNPGVRNTGGGGGAINSTGGTGIVVIRNAR